MRKQHNAIITLALWLTIISFFMLLMQWYDLKLLFVFWFIGILVIILFMEPYYFQPDYGKNINYLIALCTLIFGVIFTQKIIEIISPFLFVAGPFL
jgi:hypothetical protein